MDWTRSMMAHGLALFWGWDCGAVPIREAKLRTPLPAGRVVRLVSCGVGVLG